MNVSNAPVLVLQMHRMGDLVLSFPLLTWLSRLYPGHPVWVVGEPAFYEPLMPLSPQATYFPYESAKGFSGMEFHAVINLSHRIEAAAVASSVKCGELLGSYMDADGCLRVRGDWHLYRASLTQNNRYNLFHWADLYGLDLVPESLRTRTVWPQARAFRPEEANPRIGLFLGASEPEKRPEPLFWASLTRNLLGRGYKPVLLGGEAEVPMGRDVASRLGAHPINMCGKFTVEELAYFIRELDLLITPDTGPMHVAAWTGTPVLNLSFGPVNPWETGPFARNHHIYRPLVDCSGCWECTRPTVYCKEAVKPAQVAAVAQSLLRGLPLPSMAGDGVLLLRTARDAQGLYAPRMLEEISKEARNAETGAALHGGLYSASRYGQAFSLQYGLSHFWKAWFEGQFGVGDKKAAKRAWQDLVALCPEAASPFLKAAAKFPAVLSRLIRVGDARDERSLWHQSPSFFRPLSGFCHMYLQNENYSRQALVRALNLVEEAARINEEP